MIVSQQRPDLSMARIITVFQQEIQQAHSEAMAFEAKAAGQQDANQAAAARIAQQAADCRLRIATARHLAQRIGIESRLIFPPSATAMGAEHGD